MLPVGVIIASSFISSIACRTICCTANRVRKRSEVSIVSAVRLSPPPPPRALLPESGRVSVSARDFSARSFIVLMLASPRSLR